MKKSLVCRLAAAGTMILVSFAFSFPAFADEVSETAVWETKTAAEEPAAKQGELLGTFRASGYCTCNRCTKGSGLTYSGTVPAANHTIAADLDVFPLGTKLMIGDVVYTVEDMGGGVNGDRLDIYFATHSDALDFGSQDVEVYAVE